MKPHRNTLSNEEAQTLLRTLQIRFEKNKKRHPGLHWAAVQERLAAAPGKLWSLQQMEETGGAPDVIGTEPETGAIRFADCAPESPKGRRSLCYDRQALDERKEHKPADSALEVAAAMGIELLDEAGYRALQQLGPCDQKTSSWIRTPVEIRKLGGALFCDYRYGHVFVYHNGASSYYAARGFRGALTV
ncbi:MAG: DUF4256 domain-containing protein [Chitinophagaceae bacterium]|nr:MAG: DUF4256 domain-containing protein [Chitinophagaceae bacterium]